MSLMTEKKWNRVCAGIGLIGGLIGALGGLSGYAAYQSFKVSTPIVQQDSMIKNYNEEISSAEKRGDDEKVAKLRLELEQYLLDWRESQKFTASVSSIVKTPLAEITQEDREKVKEMLSHIESSGLITSIPKGHIGDAFLISGDAGSAAMQYTLAIAANPDNPQYYYSRARAYASLMKQANPDQKEELRKNIEKDMSVFKRLQSTSEKPLAFAVDPIILQATSERKQ
jgi:hypothetical protein